MKLSVLIFFLTLLPVVKQPEEYRFALMKEGSDIEDCIIGGKEARKNAYPFMARIMTIFRDNNEYLCGGSLISSQWVMTAAHCVYNFNMKMPWKYVTVYLGDHYFFWRDTTEQQMRAKKIRIHKNYLLYGENDIALIKLVRKIRITHAVRSGCLPEFNKEFSGSQAKALGWGMTSTVGKFASPVLKEAILPILSNNQCQRKLEDFKKEHMICTGFRKSFGQDTVFMGDSGGPLFIVDSRRKYVIVGIASFVTVVGFLRPVVELAVFTKVSTHIKWIEQTIGATDICISNG